MAAAINESNMKRYFLTFASLLFFQFNLCAQDKDMEQLVSIRFTNAPLEVILHELNDRYHIRFAFAASNSLLGQKITIVAKQQPLGDFLCLLLEQVGLRYELVGSHVVLRRKQEEQGENILSADYPAGPDDNEINGNDAGLTFIEASQGRVSDSLPRLNSMRPEELVAWDFLLSHVPAQVRQDTAARASARLSAFMIAPVFSLDFLQPDLKSNYENNQHLHTGLNFSIGAGGLWKVSDRFAGTLHILYREKDFSFRYLLEMEQGPLGIPEKTQLSLSYLEIPVGVNFILLRHHKVTLYGAPEFFGSLLLRQEEKTWLDDGRLFNTTAMQGSLLANFLWGGRAVAGLSYALSNRLFVSITPVYQYTANKLKDGPQQIKLREWQIRSGLWIRL